MACADMEQEAPRQSRQQAGASWEYHCCKGKLLRRGAESCSQALLSVLAPRLRAAPHKPHDTPYTALPGSNVTAGCSSFPSLASSAGGSGEKHTAWGQGGKLSSQTRLIQRRDNKPVMASGLTEPSAILESNRLPAAALKSKQSFLWIFPINANLFCFAN